MNKNFAKKWKCFRIFLRNLDWKKSVSKQTSFLEWLMLGAEGRSTRFGDPCSVQERCYFGFWYFPMCDSASKERGVGGDFPTSRNAFFSSKMCAAASKDAIGGGQIPTFQTCPILKSQNSFGVQGCYRWGVKSPPSENAELWRRNVISAFGTSQCGWLFSFARPIWPFLIFLFTEQNASKYERTTLKKNRFVDRISRN